MRMKIMAVIIAVPFILSFTSSSGRCLGDRKAVSALGQERKSEKTADLKRRRAIKAIKKAKAETVKKMKKADAIERKKKIDEAKRARKAEKKAALAEKRKKKSEAMAQRKAQKVAALKEARKKKMEREREALMAKNEGESAVTEEINRSHDLLAEGDKLYGEGKYEEASEKYRMAREILGE